MQLLLFLSFVPAMSQVCPASDKWPTLWGSFSVTSGQAYTAVTSLKVMKTKPYRICKCNICHCVPAVRCLLWWLCVTCIWIESILDFLIDSAACQLAVILFPQAGPADWTSLYEWWMRTWWVLMKTWPFPSAGTAAWTYTLTPSLPILSHMPEGEGSNEAHRWLYLAWTVFSKF